MAYKTKELYEKAVELTENKDCHFMDDIIAGLPCSKPTFYEHFPVDSNQLNNIKDALEINRIEIKQKLRKNWSKSDNPTMELALYKLIGNEHERQKLSQTYQDNKIDGSLTVTVVRLKKPPIDER